METLAIPHLDWTAIGTWLGSLGIIGGLLMAKCTIDESHKAAVRTNTVAWMKDAINETLVDNVTTVLPPRMSHLEHKERMMSAYRDPASQEHETLRHANVTVYNFYAVTNLMIENHMIDKDVVLKTEQPTVMEYLFANSGCPSEKGRDPRRWIAFSILVCQDYVNRSQSATDSGLLKWAQDFLSLNDSRVHSDTQPPTSPDS